MLREWLTVSDEWLSPQAAVLSPDAAWRIAAAIVGESGPYRRTVAAGRAALAIIGSGAASGVLQLAPKERQWLSRLEREFDEMPSREALIAEMTAKYGHLFDWAAYGEEALAGA